MTIANNDIRTEIKMSNILLWQVAEKLEIADTTFSRKLRHELPENEKAKIRSIIKELSKN